MRYVALLRAINVGKRIVKMEPLRAIFVDLGMRDVTTFINSGNVLFTSNVKDRAKLTATLETGLERALGFAVPVFLRTGDEMAAAAAQVPRARLDADPSLKLYVTYFGEKPTAVAARGVKALSNETIEHWVNERELYSLIIPPGDAVFSAASVEKVIGLRGTARNWKSTIKLAGLLNG
ncbi:MAG: DUF1697 domain-containing protein [Pyrinomonadaceae bacterium]